MTISPNVNCTTCGKAIEPDARFCLHCGTAAARTRRLRRRVRARFVWSFLASLTIAIIATAFFFRGYLGPPAAVLGEWSGAVAPLPPDAGSYANAGSIDISITRIGQGGSLIGTIVIGSVSAPISGHVHGHHVSIVADFSPASVAAPHPRFTAEGTLDGDTIETHTRFAIGDGDAALIDEPVALLRGSKRRAAPSSPAAATQTPQASADASAVATLVTQYYGLWDAQRLVDAYGLLSERYRAQHPYGEWETAHEGVAHISVQTSPTADPMTVEVVVRSTDRRGSGTVESEYRGTWSAVREAEQLRLDRVELKRTR